MEEWTDEFVEKSSSELVAIVEDWKYDFGANDRECSAMLLWMAMKLDPGLALKLGLRHLDLEK